MFGTGADRGRRVTHVFAQYRRHTAAEKWCVRYVWTQLHLSTERRLCIRKHVLSSASTTGQSSSTNTCGTSQSACTSAHKPLRRGALMVMLQQVANTMPVWCGRLDEPTPPLCGGVPETAVRAAHTHCTHSYTYRVISVKWATRLPRSSRRHNPTRLSTTGYWPK